MSEDVGLLASLAAHVVLAEHASSLMAATDEVKHLASEGSSMMLDDVGGCWSAGFTGCTRGVSFSANL